MANKLIAINSSNGTLMIDSETGEVSVEESDYDNDDLRQIVRFDLDEWRKEYPGEECEGGDILDFGYWSKREDGEWIYEPPVEEWRKEWRDANKE